MQKLDKALIGLVLFPIFPLMLLFAGWWGGYLFLPEKYIPVLGLIGIVLGGVMDVVFVKGWVQKGFLIHKSVLILIYLFYSVCVFGFFMGVPVFNVFVGMFAGVYVARSIQFNHEDTAQGLGRINRTSIFTSEVLLFICIISAYLARRDPYTGDSLRGMLHLSFEVTKKMIDGLIIFGGVGLIISQYWVTKKTSIFILNRNRI